MKPQNLFSRVLEEFLEGLEFELGEGFVPHPLFAKCIESQVQAGFDMPVASSSEFIVQGD